MVIKFTNRGCENTEQSSKSNYVIDHLISNSIKYKLKYHLLHGLR